MQTIAPPLCTHDICINALPLPLPLSPLLLLLPLLCCAAAAVAAAADHRDAHQTWAIAATGGELGSLLNAAVSAVGLALTVLLYLHNLHASGCVKAQLALNNCVAFTSSCMIHGLICYSVSLSA
jgi:hypothetical protein